MVYEHWSFRPKKPVRVDGVSKPNDSRPKDVDKPNTSGYGIGAMRALGGAASLSGLIDRNQSRGNSGNSGIFGNSGNSGSSGVSSVFVTILIIILGFSGIGVVFLGGSK